MNEVEFKGLFGQQGWICPKCGRVYSPYTQMCLYCSKKIPSTNTTRNPIIDCNEYTERLAKVSAECVNEIKNKENGTEQ